MGVIITGGEGDGYAAGVSEENRLKTAAITTSIEHHANQDEGNAYSVLFAATPTGAGDCFFYMKNEDVVDMIIEGISLYLPAAEYVDVVIGDVGTPVGGADVTPGNLNAQSGNQADGTFQQGNDITGLSGGRTVARIYKLAGTGSEYVNFEQDIIIPKNSTFTLKVQTGTTALAGWVDFYHHESA